MLFRTAINDRNEESSRIEYKNRILQRGMNSHGRSKAVSIKKKHAPLQSDRPCPRDLLAAAHTAEALYLAHEDAPNNVQVRQTIAFGLEVIEPHQNTPEDVQRFFVFALNQDHGGSTFNPQQLLGARLRLQARWEEHRTNPGNEITVAPCGGRAQYEAYQKNWLKNARCEHFSPYWVWYRDLGIYMNALQADGRMDEFQNVLSKYFNNVSRPMGLDSMFRNLKVVNDMMVGNYKTSLSADRYNQIWWKVSKCCKPLQNVTDHKCCLHTYEAPSPQMISSLTCSMADGRVVPLKYKCKAKATGKQKKRLKPSNAQRRSVGSPRISHRMEQMRLKSHKRPLRITQINLRLPLT